MQGSIQGGSFPPLMLHAVYSVCIVPLLQLGKYSAKISSDVIMCSKKNRPHGTCHGEVLEAQEKIKYIFL